MGYTFSEKLLAKKCGRSHVKPGEIVTVHPDVLLTDEAAAEVIRLMAEIGVEKPVDPEKICIILDHCSPAATAIQAENHLLVRKFVKKHAIRRFYEVGEGICHQVLAEDGIIVPGTLLVGSDSHTITNGALGAFSIGISRTEMAGLYITGEIWLQVPASIQIRLHGKLRKHVQGKDVALKILQDLGENGALYMCVEFTGSGITTLNMDDRRAISNMMSEAGAKTAFFPPDAVTRKWLQYKPNEMIADPIIPDENARYFGKYEYDMGKIDSLIAHPHSPANVSSIPNNSDIRIDQALIGTCTGGRYDDLATAARILKGRHIDSGVRLLISPVSRKVFMKALQSGVVDALVQAGAVFLPPGCGPCAGVHQGVLGSGEVCVSAGARNYQGRMGSNQAEIYLASPATVAASALEGRICNPMDYIDDRGSNDNRD